MEWFIRSSCIFGGKFGIFEHAGIPNMHINAGDETRPATTEIKPASLDTAHLKRSSAEAGFRIHNR